MPSWRLFVSVFFLIIDSSDCILIPAYSCDIVPYGRAAWSDQLFDKADNGATCDHDNDNEHGNPGEMVRIGINGSPLQMLVRRIA